MRSRYYLCVFLCYFRFVKKCKKYLQKNVIQFFCFSVSHKMCYSKDFLVLGFLFFSFFQQIELGKNEKYSDIISVFFEEEKQSTLFLGFLFFFQKTKIFVLYITFILSSCIFEAIINSTDTY